jgi:hypothetical protein
MANILSPLSLYGGNRKTKLPLLHNTRIHTPEGNFGNSHRSTIGRKPDDHTSLPSTQALRSWRLSSASKSLSAPGSRLRPPSLRSWLCGWTKEPNSFVVNLHKPRELDAASTPIPLMTWPPQSSQLDLGFEAQPRNRTQLCLAFLATMWPALDPFRPPGPSRWAYLSFHSLKAT